MKQVLALDVNNYIRHRLHSEERDWAETNCYVDIWIELLHALGFEPIAGLPFTFCIDFEGDQWTFFKFPLADIETLYGLDVQELAIWKPLVIHIEEQVGLGRPVLVELDSYYLPDTAGSAYKIAHVKSTVAVVEFDYQNQHMGYFHGQGYYHLDGEDFSNVFYLAEEDNPSRLPPYVEFVKMHQRVERNDAELVELSLQLLQKHLRLLPPRNPFIAFKERFQQDLPWLMGESLETFHQYSFASLRQYGACYELSATYLKWLKNLGQTQLDDAITAFSQLSNGGKTLQFQLARAISRKKQLDLTSLDTMGAYWEKGIDALMNRYH